MNFTQLTPNANNVIDLDPCRSWPEVLKPTEGIYALKNEEWTYENNRIIQPPPNWTVTAVRALFEKTCNGSKYAPDHFEEGIKTTLYRREESVARARKILDEKEADSTRSPPPGFSILRVSSSLTVEGIQKYQQRMSEGKYSEEEESKLAIHLAFHAEAGILAVIVHDNKRLAYSVNFSGIITGPANNEDLYVADVHGDWVFLKP